jgi:hypothetical protein
VGLFRDPDFLRDVALAGAMPNSYQIQTFQIIEWIGLVGFISTYIVIRLLGLHLPFPKTLGDFISSLFWIYPGVDRARVAANQRAWMIGISLFGIVGMIVFYQRLPH